MSAALVRRASAQRDGTVKDRSYLPLRGPWVKLQTNGVVFRYLTIEMRSFGKLAFFPDAAERRPTRNTGVWGHPARALRRRFSIAEMDGAILCRRGRDLR